MPSVTFGPPPRAAHDHTDDRNRAHGHHEVLREHGHSPSEAFNETVEEATQSLYPLIAENGMDWMYANCSTTAQRGALDWWKKFRDAVAPVFEDLYDSVGATMVGRTLTVDGSSGTNS